MEPSGEDKQIRVRNLRLFFFYIFLFSLFFILFNPYLWINPLSQILSACLYTGLDRIPMTVFYLGKMSFVHSLPWHYVPVWIIVSTPVMYMFFFFIGSYAGFKTFFDKKSSDYTTKRNMVLFLLWFFVPLLISKGKIYDSWRHLFFIYPALVLIAISGLQYIWVKLRNEWPKKISIYLQSALALIVLGHLIAIAGFMIKIHPYEDIFYFNSLAGKNLNEAKVNLN